MDKLNREWLSATLDGEHDVSALSDQAEDVSLQKKWRNYHLIGDALRSDLPPIVDLDLSASISAKIGALPEESVDSPNLSAIKSTSNKQKTTIFNSNVVPLFKQFGHYAIAASVALFAVLGVQQYKVNNDALVTPLPVLDTLPLVGSASPVSLQTRPLLLPQENSVEHYEQERRINSYIQDHMLQQRLNAGADLEQDELQTNMEGH